jgi:hydroxymethylbilane synthase
LVLRPDGSEAIEAARTGAVNDATRIGRDAGIEIKGRMPPDFLTG